MASTKQRNILVAGGAAAAAVLIAGGAVMASAASSSTESSTGTYSMSAASGGGHEHTEVTGDELTSVTDAVTAQFEGVTVTSVQKDPDGSYDIEATNADGSTVRYEASADLSSITERQGRGGGRGHGDAPGSATQDDSTTTDS
ncbi:MAG: hypothetical protein ACK5MT_19470 [Actinomycetales bacterium]